MTNIDPLIFRAYDIRGRAHEQITPEACRLIGQAFGSILRDTSGKDHPRVVLGRDARTHGPELMQAVLDGLMKAGCHVILIGQVPSPVNYFAVSTMDDIDGGAQVTASHNPAHDNGIKLCTEGCEPFFDDHLQNLRERIEEGNLLEGEGSSEEIDVETPYLLHLHKVFGSVAEGLKIAVDSGNGVAGPLYCKALRQAGADVMELYTEPDGTFPNHPADPSKWDTLADLQKLVVEHDLDCGLAFDGDGDRVGLVDELGSIQSADHVLLMLAKDHLSRNPGAPIVFTVSNSGLLDTEIRAWGGKPVMCKVGHSYVEHAMHDHGSKLGGEQSGHFFCGEDYFDYDDALVASLRLLSYRQSEARAFSSLAGEFPDIYQSPEKRPHVPDDKKTNVVTSITEHFDKHHDTVTLDGVRIEFGDGAWAGIRQSNTSPCISICIEARTPERLKEIEDLVHGHLQGYDEISWEK